MRLRKSILRKTVLLDWRKLRTGHWGLSICGLALISSKDWQNYATIMMNAIFDDDSVASAWRISFAGFRLQWGHYLKVAYECEWWKLSTWFPLLDREVLDRGPEKTVKLSDEQITVQYCPCTYLTHHRYQFWPSIKRRGWLFSSADKGRLDGIEGILDVRDAADEQQLLSILEGWANVATAPPLFPDAPQQDEM